MRLTAHATLALLAGLAYGAHQDPAEVYLIRTLRHGQEVPQLRSDRDAPQLPRQMARHIFLQRIGADHSSLLSDLPDGIDQAQAISHINEYGREPTALFDRANSWGWAPNLPSQGILVIEGVTPQNSIALKAALKKKNVPMTFTVRDLPSSSANRHLVDIDLRQGGILQGNCGIEDVFDKFGDCWKFGRFVGSVDLKKATKSLKLLTTSLARIQGYPEMGDSELIIILLPESSRDSPIAHWTTNAPSKLQARAETESVIFEGPPVGPRPVKAEEQAKNVPNFRDFVAVKTAVPSCMGSFNSCMTLTANCSGHGSCRDRFVTSSGAPTKKRADGGEEPAVCFACHCVASMNRPEGQGGISTTQWAGNMCQKIDVSVPFWLITGFTLVIIGALTGAIGLLYSIGEEKLPGVIGAGVSRPK